ncbi:MAG: putative Flp pilus-assembly TadE/G-like [Solirubrobacteraceae bacterium]|nr:putative Flp pilus-assembly TadE/G-like [Solirubrobacteraceae bacterium]
MTSRRFLLYALPDGYRARVRRGRSGEESGVVIVLVAGMLVVILGMAALAIDIGSFYQAQRQAQAAADAGALAASQDLPSSAVAAAADGTTYASRNFPAAHVTVTPNYNNVSNQVKVTVSAQTPSFFGQLFGITHADVNASAVAGGNGSAAPAAIFGYDSSCLGAGVQLNGQSETIIGSVISNGNLEENTNANSKISTATYGGPNAPPAGSSCTSFTNNSPNGTGATFTYGPTVNPQLQAFPTDYSQNLPGPCIYPTDGTNKFVWSHSGPNYNIPTGVYCADEIDITGNNITANGAVFIASKFVITGNNDSFSAPGGPSNLLFYDTSATPFVVGTQGNSITINGAIYAPLATVKVEGNTAGTSFIEGNDVIIEGNSFNVTGAGPVIGGPGNTLFQ